MVKTGKDDIDGFPLAFSYALIMIDETFKSRLFSASTPYPQMTSLDIDVEEKNYISAIFGYIISQLSLICGTGVYVLLSVVELITQCTNIVDIARRGSIDAILSSFASANIKEYRI